MWLIPASAGNTLIADLSEAVFQAHPRERGEHGMAFLPDSLATGPSPPARGARAIRAGNGWADGLIPAGAGNTGRKSTTVTSSRAHPRMHGEHAVSG